MDFRRPMKVLFVRPPRYMWPFNSESSSFWQPLGMASMAAVLLENNIELELIDCLAIKMGWKTLKKTVSNKDFDVLCVGDETASAWEAIKLIQFVKKIKPKVKVVAGGYFFSYMEERALNEWGIDYIIRGEAEQTMLELVACLSGKKKVKSYLPGKDFVMITSIGKIDGIIHKDNDKIVINKQRAPLDMNKLPFPAYDLLPMKEYGKNSKNHQDFAAIEHGRGCTGGCDFCSISKLYSYKGKCGYRTKTPKRSFEETRILVEKYGRKTLNWADGTFNLDPEWSKEYFELLAASGIKVQHTAWMRADCVIRDEKLGVMKLMVDNGLVQGIIGMERMSEKENLAMNVKDKDYDTCMNGFKILNRYKKVYTIATLIYGVPGDNSTKLRKLRKFIYTNPYFDFPFILPYTPYPGTKAWEECKKKFSAEKFKSWNLHRPVVGTKYLTRKQLDNWFKMTLLLAVFGHTKMYKKALFEKNPRKKRIQYSLMKKLFKGLIVASRDFLTGRDSLEYGRKPKWYDL
jgi:anaerobic magnesium-protoporphyrin IX monomethyl ester cyclase